jgi:cation:H+ antiporter
MSQTSAWLAFAGCAAVIGFAGVRLSRYGDAIARLSGAGRTWVGLVLLATVTSLPELVTGLSAVTVAQAPDLAVGDALGSCVVNLALLVIVDLFHRQASFYRRVRLGHVLSASFGIMLIGLAGLDILLHRLGSPLLLAGIGLTSPLVLLLYVVAIRILFRYESDPIHRGTDAEDAAASSALTLRQATWGYARWSLAIVAAGVVLPLAGESVARTMGWDQSFVGTLFVALATSLPEMVVTIAAVRQGAPDLAIGNLFGSNLFNMVVLALDDIAWTRGPLLASVAPVHAVTSLSAVMMTGVAIAALVYKPEGRLFRIVGWTSLILFAIYLMNSYILFLYGTRLVSHGP